jgi:hypothetical protein
MPRFQPGIELNEAFYREVVGPALAARPHSAALLGWGSEILGLDDARSTDHGWGPRLQVFVAPEDVDDARATLEARLPAQFRGSPTRYGWDDTPVQHHVRVEPFGKWLIRHLGFDPRAHLDHRDWLVTPQQQLLGVVRGAVYHDGLGELHPVREQLRWYPAGIWIWMLACAWRRISQEEAFVGRTAEVGDELGSRLVAGRLVRELMRLCFLLQREYWPYTKWFGSAFTRLEDDDGLGRVLAHVVEAADHETRERGLVQAYDRVAARHNAAGLTTAVDPQSREFYDRGFLVLMADRFVDACLAEVSDPWLRSQPLVGSVDQFVDSTDALYTDRARRLGAVYESSSTS